MRKNTVKLCICAVLTAMFVGLDYYADALSKLLGGTIKISVSGLPIIIAAVLFGPLWGGATGFVGAFLTQMLSYGFSATTFLWVMPATVRGLAMGLLFILFKKSTKTYILAVETVISSLLVTALNTFVMYVDARIYHYPVALFGIQLVNRVIVGVITAIVFAVIIPPIIKIMKKYT